jgi:four helix bundle protein
MASDETSLVIGSDRKCLALGRISPGGRCEFARKLRIPRGEAREAVYRLRLVRDAELIPAARLADLTREAEEILRILVTIVKNASKE